MTCKGGIRTRDLLVMSQTSCQTALPCCIQMQFLGGSASVYVMRRSFTTPFSAIRLAYPLHLILHDTIIKHSKGHCKDTILTSFCLLQNQCIYSK